MAGVKLLVTAFEGSGKTVLVSQLKDALIVSTDNKAFTGKVAHFRFNEYAGFDDLIDTINSKIGAYNEKYGKYPKTLVIDSVTHLANLMERYYSAHYKGFDIWKQFGNAVAEFNHYLETVILPNDVNVVLTAHCQYNSESARYEISTPGSFGKNGSWLAVVDNGIFLELKSNKRIVHHSTIKFPCRSLPEANLPESIEADKYDINKHIEILESLNTESSDFLL